MAVPDFRGFRAKQNTFDGLDAIACTEPREGLEKQDGKLGPADL